MSKCATVNASLLHRLIKDLFREGEHSMLVTEKSLREMRSFDLKQADQDQDRLVALVRSREEVEKLITEMYGESTSYEGCSESVGSSEPSYATKHTSVR